ncbi:MAG: hypothetical protein ACRD3K_03725 [Edaphobacter sp.]
MPHAKQLLADDARAIIGSTNLAPGSFDSRREPAIAVSMIPRSWHASTGKPHKK